MAFAHLLESPRTIFVRSSQYNFSHLLIHHFLQFGLCELL